LGDYTKNQNQITYVKGDVQFSAGMTGAGVLLVDGNLKMSGQALFAGLIMVRGDCELSGGGNGVHLYGGLMVQNPLPPTEIKLTGNSHVDYSSNGLKWVKGLTGGKMGVKFWNQLK
jgi:formylmethanofuran dehydrogenase subunit C